MKLIRRSFEKSQITVTKIVSKAPASRRWLPLVIETVFAVIIVASLIRIIRVSFQRPGPQKRENNNDDTKCFVSNCRVVCHGAPYYGAFEEDIVYAVMEAETNCSQVYLTLNEPGFLFGTVTLDCFIKMPNYIHHFAMIGGNLKHIPPYTFVKPFARKIFNIDLENVIIDSWTNNMLLGLSSLKRLYIRNSTINNIEKDALRAVEGSLEVLIIISSGSWNPVNLTGSVMLSKLVTVDFSHNNFNSIIGRNSFTRIRYCKVLNLSFCKISSIGPGAFDDFHNIKIIYLNNNFLTVLPSYLFHNINLLENEFKIDLKDNLWHCDCNSRNLIYLTRNNKLTNDPHCNSPREMREMFISDLAKTCYFDSNVDLGFKNDTRFRKSFNVQTKYLDINTGCRSNDILTNISLTLISPVSYSKCEPTKFENFCNLMLASRNQRNINAHLDNWYDLSYHIERNSFTMIELAKKKSNNFGLLWFKNACPSEIYCVNNMPDYLRVYSSHDNEEYTFCPFISNSGQIDNSNCISCYLEVEEERTISLKLIKYIFTALIFLLIGATCIYSIIRYNPSLLRGSKRLLFVKHKPSDILLVSSKSSTEYNLENETNDIHNNIKFELPKNNIFVVSQNVESIEFRRNSLRSNKSSDPSYISAEQPTDTQLIQWRLKHQLDDFSDLSDLTINDDSPYMSCTKNLNKYYSLDQISDRTYLSLK